MIASPLAMAHTCAVVETNAPRFGDQTVLRRTTAARRYFTSASSLGGRLREGFAPAGPLGRRFANAAFCPPSPFGDGMRVQPSSGAAQWLIIPRARPHNPSPSVELEGRAAQLASLTLLLYGNGREAFNNLFEQDRDNILWLVADLATEVRDAVSGGVQ